MFNHPPPFRPYSKWKRISLIDLYACYCYVLNGYAKKFIVCTKEITSYEQSRPYVKKINIWLTVYFVFVPIFMIITMAIREFVGEEDATIGPVKLIIFVNILTASLTIATLPQITSFCISFKKIFPFYNAHLQIHTVLTVRLIRKITFLVFNITERFVHEDTDDYEGTLLSTAIFAFIFFVNSIACMFIYRPSTLTAHHDPADEDLMVSQNLKRTIDLNISPKLRKTLMESQNVTSVNSTINIDVQED